MLLLRQECTDSNRSIDLGRRFEPVGVGRDDLLHHGNEALLISLAQIGDRLEMSGTRRHFHLPQQRGAGFGKPAKLRAAVSLMNGACDKAARLQALKRSRGGRAIECHVGRQRGLVGRSTFRERREKTVLKRSDLKTGAGLLEQRDVDLMQPPDQEAGALFERPGKLQ